MTTNMIEELKPYDLRDCFAAFAMHAYIVSTSKSEIDKMLTSKWDHETLAHVAYVLADNMLAERSKWHDEAGEDRGNGS